MSVKKLFEIDSDITPICPYCEQEIDAERFLKGGDSIIQKVETMTFALKTVAFMTTVYFCPHCRKILGINKTK
jgi:hypothetical protein